MEKLKNIEVQLTRLEKRGRKVIIVFESDLFSNEAFVCNPFRGQEILSQAHFVVSVTEHDGQMKGSVKFGSCLNHYTKQHSQVHHPIETLFLGVEDSILNFIRTAPADQISKHKTSIIRVASEESEQLHSAAIMEFKIREEKILQKQISEAIEKQKQATEELHVLLGLAP